MSDGVTGGQLVVRMLVSLGIRHVFGIPGGQTLAITDAILDEPQIEFVTARHEGSAAVMADAYGRLTGTPAVCLSTTGPGATNLLTGVGGAMRDSSPCLVITCNNNGENIYKDDAQNADHVAIFRSLTKWSRLVQHGSGIKQAMEEAYVQAMTGNPGPVHLDFARDVIEAPVTVPDIASVHSIRSWVGQRPVANTASIRSAAELIMAAKRPVLWVGNGCARAGAGPAVIALAEAMRIPVVTTFNGIGTLPTTHALVFGPLSRMGTSLASRVLSNADLVIAVGNSLNAVSTGRWKLPLPQVVQIDIDPGMIGRYYGDTTYGLVGDARSTVELLTNLLADNDGAAAAADERQGWIAELQELEARWWDEQPRMSPVPPAGGEVVGGLSPADVVRSLRTVTPDNAVLIPDAGNPGVWSYLWGIRQSGTYMKPVGFGNMGFAVPAAIAAAVLDPERPILVLVGDGSLGMTLAELETLARVGGRVVIVVLNDAGYGNIRQEQLLHFGDRTIGVDFGPADYAKVSEALGIPGRRITDLSALVNATEKAFAGSSPVLFDVPIDPAVSAWTYPAFSLHDAEDG
ncbi:MAG TPA: thiamine pyrophosphate-binding protein [Trebonia sp.]|jgi:acetolactate synthase-1/2/3 large subunit|nr:thiamine pyrophosphate-binding protein [Trebonia sp.]